MAAEDAIQAVCKKRYTEKSRLNAIQVFNLNISELSVNDWFECMLNCNHRFRNRIRWLCAGAMLESEYNDLYNLIFRKLSELSPDEDISFYTTFFRYPLYHPEDDDGRRLLSFLQQECNIGYMWIKELPIIDPERVKTLYSTSRKENIKKRLFNYLAHCMDDRQRLDFVLGEIDTFYQEDYDLLPGSNFELIRYIDLDILQIFNGTKSLPENLELPIMHHLCWRKDAIMKFTEAEIEDVYNNLISTPKPKDSERFAAAGYDILTWNKYGLKFLFFNQNALESMIETGYTFSVNLWSEYPWNYVEQILDPFYELAIDSIDHASVAELLESIYNNYSKKIKDWAYPFENMMLTLLLWIGDDAYSNVVSQMLNVEDKRHWRDVNKIIELKRDRNQITKLLDDLSI